jgi:hypothetical protein
VKFLPDLNYTLVFHLLAGPPIHLQVNGVEAQNYVSIWATCKAGKDVKFYRDEAVIFAYRDVSLIQIKRD